MIRTLAVYGALISMLTVSSAAHAAGKCEMEAEPDIKIAACSIIIENRKQSLANRWDAYFTRGTGWLAKSDYERAIFDFNQALVLNPNELSALNGRGAAWRASAQYERAIADFTEVIRLAPPNASPYNNRGASYTDLRQYDKAISDFDAAIRLDPKNSAAYNNRAGVFIKKGEFNRAIADYDQSIRLNPKSETAYGNRGEAWRLQGDLQRSLLDHDTQIRVAPNSPIGYVRRGDANRYAGRLDQALKDYDGALQLYSGFIAALTGRGLTFQKLGDVKSARIEFEKALASKSQARAGINEESLETARSRLAAIESGQAQPQIPAAPLKAINATSVPTPAIAESSPLTPERAQKSATQGRRIALVIGNSAYKNVSALINPQNDADAVAKSLRNIGFENVTVANDATREKMIDALRNFANEAEKSEWAMVYYAGHGMEVGGVNYLIPIDAKIAVDRDIQFEAVPLTQVLNAADTAKKIKLVVLDACRDNPFAPRKTAAPEQIASASTAGGAIGTRSTNGRGLAEVKVQGATLVVYAAKDGQVALDGEGGNSPFAVAVVQRLATPGVEINKLFRLVRDDVMEATAGRQEPYTYGSLPGKEDFFFVSK